MKKFGLFGLIVTIFSFLFLSCNNLAYNISVSPNHTERRTVTITVTSNSHLLNFSTDNNNTISEKSSRTIAPAAISSSNLNFYIGGKDVLYNKKLTVQKVNFYETQPQQGEITLELDSSSYYLTLIAIKKDTDNTVLNNNTHIEDLLENAVLCGNTTADLLYCDSTTPIVFYMTTDGLHGKGIYDFSFYLQNWSTQSLASARGDKVCQTIQDVEAGIYQKNSLIEKTSLGLEFASHQTEDSVLSYTGTLPAGNYEFKLTFTKDKKTFSYVEDFVIIPSQTTSSIVPIPDLLMNPPEPPTDFSQGYVLPNDSNADYYYLVFNWKDKSKTEEYFEIQIQDENSNTINVTPSTIIDEKAWITQAESFTTSYGQNFYGSKNWFAGNLDKNSTWAIFYMPLGSRYISRIRSVNQAGGSSWCYGKAGSTSAKIEAGSSTAENSSLMYSEEMSATSFNTNIINLYRVKYNLNGGTFDSTNPTIPNVYYFSQDSDGIPIMKPDGESKNTLYNSGNAISLSKNEMKWKNWRQNSIVGDVINTSSNYSGFENLNLYADYSDLPNVYDSTDYSILENLEFSVTSSGSGTQPSSVLTDNKLEFKKENENYSIEIVNINYSYKNEFRYDTVQLVLLSDEEGEKGVFESSLKNSISLPVYSLDLGTYTATLKAFTSDNPIPFLYSFQIIIN